MKSELKMWNRLCFLAGMLVCVVSAYAETDSRESPEGLEWHVGTQVSPMWVVGTNGYLRGDNPEGRRIDASLAGDVRADFSYGKSTREGRLYDGFYQGIGVGVNTFFSNSLLGSPVSAYVYQGASVARFGRRVWLGYEWQFGAAFGWKRYEQQSASNNGVISTRVTARMGIGLRLHYSVSRHWQMSVGVLANHFSNGNTSWPNAGVNTLGAAVGVAYTINPEDASVADFDNFIDIDTGQYSWFYDIVAYGAWRKRIVSVGNPAERKLCPGRFGVLGLQFSPMCRLNRWVAVGPAADFQWDESAGIAPYWVPGSSGDALKFERPPLGRQLSLGLSAHAELTTPIFSVNVGLGYSIVNPEGDRAFYQSLTLKTFLCRHIYLNTGYRLGAFKDPQNLMLGVGVRL